MKSKSNRNGGNRCYADRSYERRARRLLAGILFRHDYAMKAPGRLFPPAVVIRPLGGKLASPLALRRAALFLNASLGFPAVNQMEIPR